MKADESPEQSNPYLAFALSVAATVLIPKVKKHGQACEAYKSLQLIRLAIMSLQTTHAFNAAFLTRLDMAMDHSALPSSVVDLDEEVDSVPVSVPGLAMRPKGSLMKSSEGHVLADQTASTEQHHATESYESLPIFLEGVLPEKMPARLLAPKEDKPTQVLEPMPLPAPRDVVFEQDMQQQRGDTESFTSFFADNAMSNNNTTSDFDYSGDSGMINFDFDYSLLDNSQLDFPATGEADSDYIT